MRAELPTVCRLTVANAQANRPSANHRTLAEFEDKLLCLVSRQSLSRLAPVLTDPLLKLDEVSLVAKSVSSLHVCECDSVQMLVKEDVFESERPEWFCANSWPFYG